MKHKLLAQRIEECQIKEKKQNQFLAAGGFLIIALLLVLYFLIK